MQNIKSKYDFSDYRVFDVNEGNSDASDLIQQLESDEVLERVSVIRVYVSFLPERHNLISALYTFIQKTNKLTRVLIHDSGCMDVALDYLKVLKNVPNLELILDGDGYSTTEINKLQNFFIESHGIKYLRLGANFNLVLNMINTLDSCSIEIVDIIVKFSNGIDMTIPLTLTTKLQKLSFATCNDLTGFDTFFENLITSNPSITKLSLFGFPLTTNTINTIANNINMFQSLNLEKCKIDDEMMNILIGSLITSNVTKLNIGHDHQQLQISYITDLLASNTSLQNITLIYRPISITNFVDVLKALSVNTSIKKFYYAGVVNIDDTTIKSIKQMFTEILIENYVLMEFCFGLRTEENFSQIWLNKITDRNELSHQLSRFVKTKAVTST